MRNNSVELTVADLENAKLDIGRYVQCYTYGEAHRQMSMDVENYDQIADKTKNTLIKQELHDLSNLYPYFDSYGILRVKGRLSKININYD